MSRTWPLPDSYASSAWPAIGLSQELEPHTAVFHYTDRNGLAGILNSGELWATSISYLNDTREVEHGRDLILATLSSHIDYLQRQSVSRRLYDIANAMNDWGIVPIYVCCFSEDDDSLSQWRAYAPRGGYALGFQMPQIDGILRQQMTIDDLAINFAKVVYDHMDQKALAERLVTDLEREVAGVPDEYWNERTIFLMSHRFTLGAALLSAQMKHYRFAEEREWRLIVTREKAVRYRPGATMLTPYVAVPLHPSGKVISELQLIAGPTPHPVLALDAGAKLLMSREAQPSSWSNDRFRNSEIPYRDW